MWTDPIVEEIHQIREAYAARFQYDLDAIYEDIKQQEQESEREFVILPPARTQGRNEGMILEPSHRRQ